MRIAAVLLLAFLLAALGRGPLAQELVIVESTAPHLAPGQIIKNDVAIQLPSGTSVSMIGDDGRVLNLRGPYSGKPQPAAGDSGDARVVAAISRLFAAAPAESAALGTFRGTSAQVGGFRGASPTSHHASEARGGLGTINVSLAETQCALSGEAVTLWRADAEKELNALLQRMPDGEAALVHFAAGEDEIAWPTSVPRVDGESYQLRESADIWTTVFELRLAPPTLTDRVQQVVWMSDYGCTTQARALLAALP